MSTIEEILKSKIKPTEKITQLGETLRSNPESITELIEVFEKATVSEKGNCLSAIEYITKTEPRFAESWLDFVMTQINQMTPRVKWEASTIVGNVAKEFPDKVVQAIPKLLENTKDEGTVVRWSTAFALTEIAKSNPKAHKQLIPIFSEMVKKETNNGVRNVYVKGLKAINKAKSSKK